MRPAGAALAAVLAGLTLRHWVPGLAGEAVPGLLAAAVSTGLGLGALAAGRHGLDWLWSVGLAVLAGLLFSLPLQTTPDTPLFPGAVFLLLLIPFVPLGRRLARSVAAAREPGPSPATLGPALAGALGGVGVAAVLTALGAPPAAWLAALFAVAAPVLARRRRALYAAAALVGILAGLAGSDADAYGPYGGVAVARPDGAAGARRTLVQRPVRWRDGALDRSGELIRAGYHLPYQLVMAPPRRALVLNAGAGSELAALLDEGAVRIDAVERDPAVIRLARRDPDGPYHADGVRVIRADARRFLETTDTRYDMIVLATDSAGPAAEPRYLLTREGLAAVRSALAPGGGLVAYFRVGDRAVHEHLVAALALAFDELPLQSADDRGAFNRVYLAGPAFAHLRDIDPAEERRWFRDVLPAFAQDAPRDDWPFLALTGPALPPALVIRSTALLAVSAVLALLAAPAASRPPLPRFVDLELLLYGATVAILAARFWHATRLGWGGSWPVPLAAAAVTMVAAALGAAAGSAARTTILGPLGALVVTFVAAYALPDTVIAAAGAGPRIAAAALLLAPVGSAAALLTYRARSRPRRGAALGWALLGGGAGALLQLLAFAFGSSGLVPVAGVALLGGLWLVERERYRARQAAASGGPGGGLGRVR